MQDTAPANYNFLVKILQAEYCKLKSYILPAKFLPQSYNFKNLSKTNFDEKGKIFLHAYLFVEYFFYKV